MAKFNILVKGCSACGSSHRIEFKLKPDIHAEYPYIGVCDKAGEAVSMRAETYNGGKG